MPIDIPTAISTLIDGWCERRALRPLRTILPSWPPPNGFTVEWRDVWASMRHLRAMCRDDLKANGESKTVDDVIAELSKRLFPNEESQEIEETAEKLIRAIFGNKRA